jgi:hypothetical protein
MNAPSTARDIELLKEIDPFKVFETVDWRFILTKGNQLGLVDLIRDWFENLGIDVNYSEVRGLQVIEDRKRQGI